MQVFCLILGGIITLLGVFLLCFYISIIKNSNCYIGYICDIDGGYSYGKGGTAYSIWAKFKVQEKELKVHTLSFFLSPFGEKYKIIRLRERYIGKQVHIYYNHDKPTQTVVKEFLWKAFMTSGLIVILGCVLIMTGVFL